MNRLFLGKWWHWAILVIIVGLMWFAGERKMHVIHFNFFVSMLFLGTLVALVVIVRGTDPQEQVTRDPIVDDSKPD